MQKQKRLWVIISPVYKPAPGGGAEYTDILARALSSAGEDVHVIVERYPNLPTRETFAEGRGEIHLHRIFPFRAGRKDKDFLSYLGYAAANLQYLSLPSLVNKVARVKDYDAARVLVHGSLVYRRTSFDWIINSLRPKTIADSLVIADMRDYGYPEEKLSLLERFDRITCSSQGVAEAMAERTGRPDKVVCIPMPFVPPPEPTADQVATVLAKFGLEGKRFLLNPNGISRAKHYPVMREAIPILRGKVGFEEIILLTVGRERDAVAADETSQRRGESVSLGPVVREDLLALMKAAEFTLVLSDREAISRNALEAIACGGRVILPDVAEFRDCCASHIASNITPEGIADLVASLRDAPAPNFPFHKHGWDAFLPRYLAL